MRKISHRDHKVNKQREEVLDASTLSTGEILGYARARMDVAGDLTSVDRKSSHAAVDG